MSDVHCPVRVLLTRHAEAEYESMEMRETGGSLTAAGRVQARELGERLRGERIAGIVCSDLARAVQTAEIAAGVLGLPVSVREGLHESAVGDYFGRESDAAVFDPVCASWRGGDLTASVPGGETGRQVVDRVFGVLDDLANQFRGESVLVVSHAGAMMAVMGRVAAEPPEDPAHRGLAYEVPNCATYVLEGDADGWRVG
jgi:2,3-bisphosphoglycerate-dependent phosphoglycerate mutase